MKPRLVIAQICAAIFAFSLDRFSKSWVIENLSGVVVRPLLDGFMQLHLTENTGAAFSLGRDNGGLMTAIAAIVTTLLIGWAFWRHKVNPDTFILEKIGAGLILGGAFGNLYDRFSLGRVTDFLQFTFIDFPIFNVADALIDVGIALIFIDLFRHGKQEN
ncbi:MAG: signal peptidase II [Cyanobacteria bacterium REEB67]|nr:signal peptidase II [Cyanobacteria bacterium REEB67]